jgi:poly-gamma-glutamate capsule biosynthesis protein CapA/YwtB (metallophosphatase superfamily)
MTRRSGPVVALLVAVAAVAPVSSQATHEGSAAKSFTLALAGDSIITRPLRVDHDPGFLPLVELIRGADAAFTNFEMLLHNFEGYPQAQSGGTWMRGNPELASELAWMGFDVVSRANNHAGDYSVEAQRSTTKYLQDAGLVQAGVGEDLEEARAAHFLDTPAGRLAIVSIASTFTPHSPAGSPRGPIRGRPGLNALHVETTYHVTASRLESLRGVMQDLGLKPPAGPELRFLNNRFVASDHPGIETVPRAADVEAMAAVVRNASRLADHVMVTIHAHEGLPGDRTQPAQFLVTFAHAMIDAGADIFVGHGPHIVRGIEIYKGKPILYSVGNFIFENDLVLEQPADAYQALDLGPQAGVADFDDARSKNDTRSFPADRDMWQSIIATVRWRGKTLDDITLHPIALGFGRPRIERGRPAVADPSTAKAVIDEVAQRSKPFGTDVEFEHGLGRVVIPGASSSAQRER